MSDEEHRDEPLEEVGAEECDPQAQECNCGSLGKSVFGEQLDVSLREEMFEVFKPELEVMVASQVDGLPVPANESSTIAIAHPFTVEAVVCVEDKRTYVELFSEELSDARCFVSARSRGHVSLVAPSVNVVLRWLARLGRRLQVHARSRYDEHGAERTRVQFSPELVEERFGCALARLDGDRFVVVRPARPRCEYYRRQIMANDDCPDPGEFGHFVLFRNCTKRRSVGGAYMSVRDEAVYACDYRSPPDAATVQKYLDDKDDKRLLSSEPPEQVPLFNLEG